MNFKKEQLENKIQIFIAEIILEDISNENLRNKTSVVDVKLNNDFSKAKVYVNFLNLKGQTTELEKLITLLRKDAPHIRYLLAKKISMKNVPILEFELDHLIEDINKMEEIIEKIKVNNEN